MDRKTTIDITQSTRKKMIPASSPVPSDGWTTMGETERGGEGANITMILVIRSGLISGPERSGGR